MPVAGLMDRRWNLLLKTPRAACEKVKEVRHCSFEVTAVAKKPTNATELVDIEQQLEQFRGSTLKVNAFETC